MSAGVSGDQEVDLLDRPWSMEDVAQGIARLSRVSKVNESIRSQSLHEARCRKACVGQASTLCTEQAP